MVYEAKSCMLTLLQTANDVEASAPIHTEIPPSPATKEPEVTATPEPKQDLLNQTCELGMATPSEDEFVPGALCE